jgi:uncharacterized membrane protein SirB2
MQACGFAHLSPCSVEVVLSESKDTALFCGGAALLRLSECAVASITSEWLIASFYMNQSLLRDFCIF